MSLNPSYVVAINLQESLIDKDTGLPLSNGYVQFFQDTSRTTPKTVYQITGSPPNYTYSPLSNPLVLSAIGVPVNSDGDQVPIYYYPYDDDGEIQLYYIAVYSEAAVLQYTLEAWPNITAEDDPADQNNSVSNQISNCQFSQVNFVVDQGLVITFAGALAAVAYQIAPDWEVIITSSGAGSLTIEQVALEGSLTIETNPPYKLTFSPSGVTITRLVLRQTFNHNPDIWSATTDGGGYISGIMLVESLDGQAHTLEMQYVQSGGPSAPQTIVTGSTLTSGYQLLNNTVLLNAGTNTDNADVGAIYIDILLPNTGFYSVTSVQVVGLNDDNALVSFEQESVNRQLDHLFHYYKAPLDFKPIKSYLCGWDFPLNPAQPLTSTVAAWAGASKYVWDQTIIWQSVASSISVTRSTVTNIKGSMDIEVVNTCQFAVIQYLTVPQIIDLLSNDLSSNIVLSSNQSALSGMITLWYTEDSTAPNINTDSKSLVTGLTAAGKPTTFNGTWLEIPRSNYGDAIFTTEANTDINNLESFGFNGWNFDQNTAVDTISSVTYVAIVIGFSSVTAANNVVIQSCSLVPGTVPTVPAPQTANDVLADCQYYWEQSYYNGVISGTVTENGKMIFPQHSFYTGANTNAYSSPFSLLYKENKVSAPIYTIYNPKTGTADSVVSSLGGTANDQNHTFSSFYGLIGTIGTDIVNFKQETTTATVSLAGQQASDPSAVFFHYTLDSRIGVY